MIASNLNGWQRLFVLLAIAWAVPAIAWTVSTWPKSTTEMKSTAEIKSQWAAARIEVFRKHHGKGQSLPEFRRQWFGDKSDEEIIQPKEFDIITAVPTFETDPDFQNSQAQSEEAMAIDNKYETMLNELSKQSGMKSIEHGVLIWLIPLVLIYSMGVGVHWVSDGFRKR